jgi:Lon protease-like protein
MASRHQRLIGMLEGLADNANMSAQFCYVSAALRAVCAIFGSCLGVCCWSDEVPAKNKNHKQVNGEGTLFECINWDSCSDDFIIINLGHLTKFYVGTFDVIPYRVTDVEKVGPRFDNIMCIN